MALELRGISPRARYFAARLNAGCIGGKEVVLVDTGIDEDVGRRLVSLSKEAGLEIRAIVNTHSHSDHFSANSAVVGRTGAKVWAPRTEAAIIESPHLEPYSLWGMASPPEEYVNKYTQGIACKVDHIYDSGPLEVDGVKMEAIDLSGHSINQQGILFEGILFAGDGIFGRETLAKHRFLFSSDVSGALRALDKIEALFSGGRAHKLLPSHGELLGKEEALALVAENRRNLQRTSDAIFSLVGGNTSEDILAAFAGSHSLDMTPVQHALNHTTVRAHLTHLRETGRIGPEMRGNRLIWNPLGDPLGNPPDARAAGKS